MRKAERDGVLIDRCPHCNGVWLDAGELEKIEQGKETARAQLVHQARNELLQETARLVSIVGMCPKCQVKKLTEIKKRGVTLDYCTNCKGLFFDETELDRVLEGQSAGILDSVLSLFKPSAA
jgi:Zn-finger nucleic acid-binding protein